MRRLSSWVLKVPEVVEVSKVREVLEVSVQAGWGTRFCLISSKTHGDLGSRFRKGCCGFLDRESGVRNYVFGVSITRFPTNSQLGVTPELIF